MSPVARALRIWQQDQERAPRLWESLERARQRLEGLAGEVLRP